MSRSDDHDAPTVTATGGPASPAHAATLPQLGLPLAVGDRLGRYQVERALGAGGMGVVLLARDPELDRAVAIKVMHARDAVGEAPSRVGERLRREAQALARVVHPNVVSVFDAGVHAGAPYLVMQYVDGATLGAHLAATRPPWRAVVGMFVAAARGLAAIHAAGLIHRDVKPHNLLVDKDGTVRVSDLGLARLDDLADRGGISASSHGGGSAARTVNGALTGTPAYMAPEQFAGVELTPACDQFALCVALWEALYGERPFRGETLEELSRAVRRGVVSTPPTGDVPTWLAAVLRRGLAVAPADRFPTIDALRAALERGLQPPRSRRAWIAGGAGVIAAAAVAGWLVAHGGAAADPCRGRGDDAVWTAARRADIDAALSRLGAARPLIDRALARLDARAERWRAAAIDTCAATRVRHTQPAEVMARRDACLAASAEALDAALAHVTTDLGAGETDDVLAIDRTAPRPDACDGGPGGVVAADPAQRRRIAAISALRALGRDADVVREGEPLARELLAAGDHADAAPLLLAIGTAQQQVGSYQQVRTTLREAAQAAVTAGDDHTASIAWTLTAELAADAGDISMVDDLLSQARAAAKRSNLEAQLRVEIGAGRVELERGDAEASLRTCRAVAERIAAELSPRADEMIDALGCQSDALGRMERWEEEEQVDLRVAELSPDLDVRSLDALGHLATARARRGDRAGAEAALATLARRVTDLYGDGHTMQLRLLRYRGQVATQLGTFDAAAARFGEAIVLARSLLPADDPQRAEILNQLASVERERGRADQAVAAYTEALGVLELRRDDDEYGRTATNYAQLEVERGGCDRALPVLERVEQRAAGGDMQAVVRASALYLYGRCLDEGDRLVDAEATARRAIALFPTPTAAARPTGMDGIILLDLHFLLAQVLVERGDKAAGRAIVEGMRPWIPDEGAPLVDRFLAAYP